MKKSIKKMELKKRSISKLNAKQATGGVFPTITLFCPSRIYVGEDICFTIQQQ